MRLSRQLTLYTAMMGMRAAAMACSCFIPQHDSWNVSDADRLAAMNLMVADGLTDVEKGDVSRQFLYAKGIMRNERTTVRKLKFEDLLNPDGEMVPPEARAQLHAARELLISIVVKGEEGSNLKEGDSLFQKFVSKHPEWADPETSFVVFRDHEKLKAKPHAYVERVQRSGLCYMHAPIVLQHYLVAMHSNEPVPMLDMAACLKHMSAWSLERRIWYGLGDDSKHFLTSILVQDPRRPEVFSRSGEVEFEPHLRSLGPALISNFEVEEGFDSDEWQHLGRKTASIGKHAMVLVGCRKEGGESRYLIQNWWAKKAFVEVDGNYLISCGALITFVVTPQHTMGSFATNPYQHVECEMMDVQESFNERS